MRASPAARLNGLTFRQHVAAFVTFSLLTIGFSVLAVLSVEQLAQVPIRWLLAGFLMLSSVLFAAWELRVLFLLRRGRTDLPHPT